MQRTFASISILARASAIRIEVVDMEGGGMPVAIDTAGNVDKSVYENE